MEIKDLLPWIADNLKIISLTVLFIFLYSALHEIVHYGTAKILGHSMEIKWSLIMPTNRFLNIEEVTTSHYLLIASAPHLVSTMFLIVLFLLEKRLKTDKLAFIAIFPFMDIFYNLLCLPVAYLINKPNDFLNMIIKVRNSLSTIRIGYLIIIFLLLFSNIFFFLPFFKKIQKWFKRS